MKLLVFPLLLCLIVNSVFAGTMGDTELLSPECSVDGCNHPVWEFGVKALYLKVEYGHDPWVNKRALIDNFIGYTQTPARLRGHGWGGFIDGMYHFAPGKAFDLNLYALDYTDKINGVLTNGTLRRIAQRSKWMSGNAELHQVLPIADNNAIRVFMGVNYTYLTKQRDFNRDIRNLNLNNIDVVTGTSTGGFYGAGPRWGGHVTYHLPPVLASGFSLYGEGAAGLLLGRSRSGVIVETQPALVAINRQTHQFSVVFEFDARLGLSYTYYATPIGQVGLDLGWMVFDYLSAIEDKANAESTDVVYQGFYFGVKWLGDFA